MTTTAPRRWTVAIACFPTVGGSGIIATEIGLALARRGHRVHFVTGGVPVRLDRAVPGVWLHEVRVGDHPTLQGGSYPLALASALIELARSEPLDLIHVHYAVPHAVAAWMAAEVLGTRAPPLVTTLHGTDVTLVAADPAYAPLARHALTRSAAVTTPSRSLKDQTIATLDWPGGAAIEVLPNFVDTKRFFPRRGDEDTLLPRLFPDLTRDEAILCHASNFRPLKRVGDVVEVFAKVAAARPARLLLIGDGPERGRVAARVAAAGLSSRVALLGQQHSCVEWLQRADLFVLPSEQESFGLAALEAMACGVPVLASRVGGLPEVVDDGVTGRLAAVGDTDALAAAALDWLGRPPALAAARQAARAAAEARFALGPAIDRYESLYARVVGERGRARVPAATSRS